MHSLAEFCLFVELDFAGLVYQLIQAICAFDRIRFVVVDVRVRLKQGNGSIKGSRT